MIEIEIEILGVHKTTMVETNFGFAVIYDDTSTNDPDGETEVEIYGMTGFGRYDLIDSVFIHANLVNLGRDIENAIDQTDCNHVENCITTKKALDALTEKAPNPWVLDNRSRCVAIYRGPKQECLCGIDRQDKCVFFRSWSENTECEQPDVPERIRSEAQRVYNALTEK
jgi:hypothetical protein